MTGFEPDYRVMTAVMRNERPRRLPLYEHYISPRIMEQVMDVQFADMQEGGPSELDRFFELYCDFYRRMTYDTVSFEVVATEQFPDHGAILGGRPGPVQTRHDFEQYPWDCLPELFWQKAECQFAALERAMPPGMKAIGGVGNGVFEISEDLVGLEYLAYMQVDDPELYAMLYRQIGDVLYTLWDTFLTRFGDTYAVCRIGDDWGYKSGLLTMPAAIRTHIMPIYKRIIDLIHAHGKPFLWHSCGCIFDVMDEMISLGIDAKHSNEDQIAPFDRWIKLYGSRIALFGGIDVNDLCLEKTERIKQIVIDKGRRFSQLARGYALGSGNSIPDYVPAENYLAMIEGAQLLRGET